MILEIVLSITLAAILIMIKVVTKENPKIIMNEKYITIHKIKDKYAYAIVTFKDKVEIVTDQNEIVLLARRASYNGV